MAPLGTTGYGSQVTATGPNIVVAGGNTTSASNTADCYKGSSDVCANEHRIFDLVNQERAKVGLSPFTFSAKVSFVARAWSASQASVGRISHNGWPNSRENAYQQEFSIPFRTNAENVAMTSEGGSDLATQLMTMWMNSKGHRDNILGPGAVLGVGLATDGQGWYATQIFGYEQ